MQANRKVKNARIFSYGGMTFRSRIEYSVYRHLVESGLNPKYELNKITLQEGFRPSLPWVQDGKLMKNKIISMTYTPDFVFDCNGMKVYLEVKGCETDRFPLKRKLFLKKLADSKERAIFAQVKTVGGLLKTIDAIKKLTENEEGSV